MSQSHNSARNSIGAKCLAHDSDRVEERLAQLLFEHPRHVEFLLARLVTLRQERDSARLRNMLRRPIWCASWGVSEVASQELEHFALLFL